MHPVKEFAEKGDSIKVTTHYQLNETGAVSAVMWNIADGSWVKATLNEDGVSYTYSSELMDDKVPVTSDRKMSLADCILAANLNLGIIPPQTFDPIECDNRH